MTASFEKLAGGPGVALLVIAAIAACGGTDGSSEIGASGGGAGPSGGSSGFGKGSGSGGQ